MIVIRVTIDVPEDKQPQLLDHFANEAPLSRQLDGCQRFELMRHTEQQDRFTLYEEWRDRTAFEAYKASPQFKASAAVVFPLLGGKPESSYFDGHAFDA